MEFDIAWMEYIFKETSEGRKYLRECAVDKEKVQERPDFWKNMYSDSKLVEEKCPPKSPRIGPEYQYVEK